MSLYFFLIYTESALYQLVSLTIKCHDIVFLSKQSIFQEILQEGWIFQRIFIISSRYSPLKQLYHYFEENAALDRASNVIHLKTPLLWEVSVINISDKTVTLEDVYHDSEGNLLGKNISIFAIVNFETRKIIPIPKHFQMKAQNSPYYRERIYLEEVQHGSEPSIEIKTLIEPSDIDINRHTNYISYLNLLFKAFEALGAPRNPCVSVLEVINKNESVLGDEVKVKAWHKHSGEYCSRMYHGDKTLLSARATYIREKESKL